jgi:D-3-phosphoglycerate dehydrogenase
MKVLVSDEFSPQGLEILQKAKGVEVDVKTGLPADELRKIIGQYDALIIRSATKVTADVMEAAANLKVIGRAGVGVDNVDVLAASKKGIVVMNTPGGNSMAAAEHTVALMFSIARSIPQAAVTMWDKKWEKKRFMGMELFGKTLGVIGIGNLLWPLKLPPKKGSRWSLWTNSLPGRTSSRCTSPRAKIRRTS